MPFQLKKTRAHIELTGRCNLKCRYCYNSKFNRDEFPKEDLLRIIEECKKRGIKNFNFSGGEPFLYKDFFEILSHCKNCYVAILTNGTLLNKKMLLKIKKYPQIKELKISLDGFCGHNKVRLNSNHKVIIRNIKEIKKLLPYCTITINTIITKNNLYELLRLYRLLVNLGISQWRIDLPFYEGRYKNKYCVLKYPDFKKIIFVVKQIVCRYLKDNRPFKLHIFNVYNSKMFESRNTIRLNTGMHPCDYSNWSTLCLKPDGSIIFCPSLSIPLANIYNHKTLVSALKYAKKHEFFKIKLKQLKCKNCRYLNICEGGCRADTYYWIGSLYSADPLCCSLFPLVEKNIWPILPVKEQELFKKSLIKSNKRPYSLNNINEIMGEKNESKRSYFK